MQFMIRLAICINVSYDNNDAMLSDILYFEYRDAISML